MKKLYLLLIAFAFIGTFSGCKIEGCTDESAWNFDPDATSDDGSCLSGLYAYAGIYNTDGNINCPISGQGPKNDVSVEVGVLSNTSISLLIDGYLPLTATTNGTSFTINSQLFQGYTYTGSGNFSNGINLTMNEEDPFIGETCVYTLSGPKQ